MLGILLLILKIIGIIILSVLGLVLVLVLVILLVPIRYEADVSFINKKPSGIAGVHWLLRLLQIHFSFGKDVNGLQIKIAGKKLGGGKKTKKASKASTSKKKKNESEPKSSAVLENSISEEQQEKDQELLEETAKLSDEKTQISENTKEISACENKTVLTEAVQEDASESSTISDSTEDDQPKESLSEKIDKIHNTICQKIDGIRTKLEGLDKKRLWIASLLEYLQTEPMKQSLVRLKNNLIKILLHILPQKGTVDLQIGFKNPATTGQLLGILGMLYPRFNGKLSVTPYFDKSILEGEVAFQGRIRLMTLVIVGVKTILDKNIRTFIKKVRNGGKE